MLNRGGRLVDPFQKGRRDVLALGDKPMLSSTSSKKCMAGINGSARCAIVAQAMQGCLSTQACIMMPCEGSVMVAARIGQADVLLEIITDYFAYYEEHSP